MSVSSTISDPAWMSSEALLRWFPPSGHGAIWVEERLSFSFSSESIGRCTQCEVSHCHQRGTDFPDVLSPRFPWTTSIHHDRTLLSRTGQEWRAPNGQVFQYRPWTSHCFPKICLSWDDGNFHWLFALFRDRTHKHNCLYLRITFELLCHDVLSETSRSTLWQ